MEDDYAKNGNEGKVVYYFILSRFKDKSKPTSLVREKTPDLIAALVFILNVGDVQFYMASRHILECGRLNKRN